LRGAAGASARWLDVREACNDLPTNYFPGGADQQDRFSRLNYFVVMAKDVVRVDVANVPSFFMDGGLAEEYHEWVLLRRFVLPTSIVLPGL
jgi:hypothetical protein